MNDKMKGKTQKEKSEKVHAAGGCKGAPKPGKSQKMKDDQTTEDDIVGASNYERAESDQSKGIFAQQTEAYNRAMDEIIENDDENAKDNLADYMDELKEESETVSRPSQFSHPNRNAHAHGRRAARH